MQARGERALNSEELSCGSTPLALRHDKTQLQKSAARRVVPSTGKSGNWADDLMDTGRRNGLYQEQLSIPDGDMAARLQSQLSRHSDGFVFVRQIEDNDA